MSTGESLTGLVRQLQAHLGDGLADLELLARYAQRGDEAAFAALVRRHGGLVLGVARRLLADRQQAEDVFQATFLALARSAARLGRPASLANWLYTVALRQARKARLREARRSARERGRVRRPSPPSDPLEEISGRELLAVIDEEMGRLPAAYRQPLLLCCVEGLSREEAGRQLGWSDGTLKGWLERGRRLLADRLARRGLAPSALVLAPLAAAEVSGDLLARTAALAGSPWSKSVPAAVLALAATGAPPRLLPATLVLGSLLVAGLVGLGAASSQKEPAGPDTPAPAAASAPAGERGDDPLPAGSTLRFGTARFRHGTAIEGFAVSPDGRLAVAASGNHWLGSTRAFDLTTGRALYPLGKPWPFVEAVALSPDGKTLAAKQDTALHLYDAVTGRELRTITPPAANPRTLTSWLTFTLDGKALAVTSEGKSIHLLDAENGTLLRSFAHQNVVYAAAFAPDGKLLAAGGYDSDQGGYFARLWEVATGKELRRFSGARGGLRCLAFSPDGATLAGGGDDGRLRLWDVVTGRERRVFDPDGRRLRSVTFAPDGKTLAAAGDTIRLYDRATGHERLRIDRRASGLHFGPEGRVLTGAVAGAIHRWDTATGRPLTPQDAGESAVDQVVATADGRRVITRDQAGQIHVWDATTGKHLRRLEAQYQGGMAVSPDGRLIAWSVEDPGVKFPDPDHPNWTHTGSRIRLYDLAADRPLDRFAGHAGDAHELAFTPDGRTLLSLDHRDAAVRVWDVASGKERRQFRAVRDSERTWSYPVRGAVLSPDGKTLAARYRRADDTTALFGDTVVRLWDVAAGRELHELKGHINEVLGLAFSPDGRLLVTCGENPIAGGRRPSPTDRVFVWDVATGQRLAVLPEGLPLGAGCVAFSPDGRSLATASADGVIRLWEVAGWGVRAEFRGHRDRVSALAFAPDGRLLSGSIDTTVLAWDVRPPRGTAGSLDAAWEDLARPDAAEAFRAQGRLRAVPQEAVAFLAGRLKPAAPADPKRLAALVADLDSPEFATREQATRGLRELGGQAAAALREARDRPGSTLELRRRAGDLLAELEGAAVPPAELRALRAVEVLAWIGTPEACKILEGVAKGAAGARLTEAAGAALRQRGAAGETGK
jgi:RNA polymerase sigma factor (sigma-70 family)